MYASDVMLRYPQVIGPDEPLCSAARCMRDQGLTALPVCSHDRLVGMLTDRDITRRAVAAGLDPNTATVRQVMTPKVVYCFAADDLSSAAALMRERAVGHLVVLDGELRMVGMLSALDLAVAVRPSYAEAR